MKSFFLNIWNHITTWFNALHLERWYSLRDLVNWSPPLIWQGMWIYVGMLAFFLILGIALFFLKIRPSLKQRLLSFCWTNFILGAFLFFFRFERIPWLGMDLWRLLQEFAIVIWSVLIWRFYRRHYPEELLAERVQAYRSRFLPGKNS